VITDRPAAIKFAPDCAHLGGQEAYTCGLWSAVLRGQTGPGCHGITGTGSSRTTSRGPQAIDGDRDAWISSAPERPRH
jgi:hypothetical protein